MLQVKNRTITHRKDLRVILDNFNMVLNDGDKAVIIGEVCTKTYTLTENGLSES